MLQNRARLVFLALLFAAFPSLGRGDVPPSSVPAVASPSANESPCEAPDPIGPEVAFSHVIDDPRTLALIAYAENLTGRDRAAVVRRASTPLPTAVTDEVRQALDAGCIVPEIAYRSTRLIYALAKRWSSSDDAIGVGRDARFAIASLLLGNRISATARDATLAVFGTSEADLDALVARTSTMPSPAPSASAANESCPSSDATATLPVSPDYPLAARAERVEGSISLRVVLDEHGYVKAVTLFKRNAPDLIGGDALVTAATIAAGVSNFQPEFVNCKPLAGTYIFRADFRAQR